MHRRTLSLLMIFTLFLAEVGNLFSSLKPQLPLTASVSSSIDVNPSVPNASNTPLTDPLPTVVETR